MSILTRSVDRLAARGYNIGVRAARLPTAPKTMALPPLTIRKPETMIARLASTEADTVAAAAAGTKAETTVRINGQLLTVTVTPSVQPGRVYTLFYLDGKRTAKGAVPNRLLANK